MKKLTPYTILLISMPLIGIIGGFLYHQVVMPLFGDELIHCMTLGMVFGFINYLTAYVIYKKYFVLKKSNKLLNTDLALDKLTGLLNRRAFDNDIIKISEISIFSMIFIDIDNFRIFNNEFGHQAGDVILKKTSEVIKACTRLNDKVYRYGGEEIIVVLKDCIKKNAYNIAEKIRLSISQMDNSSLPNIAVSLGVSSYPEDGENIDEIIKNSDNAMLAAKKLGKNRTMINDNDMYYL